MPHYLKDSHIPDCPEEFKELEVLYENSWADYEECGWIVIFKFFDEIMVEEGGYSVMAESNAYRFDPYHVLPEQMDEIVKHWEKLDER